MTKSIGNYQVIRQLGEGHYGTVYLAVGEVPARGPKPPRRRVVAIKTLREDADEEAMALLTQEFALLEQVKHRGIVRVFEYLYDENVVVMEHIHAYRFKTCWMHSTTRTSRSLPRLSSRSASRWQMRSTRRSRHQETTAIHSSLFTETSSPPTSCSLPKVR